MQQHSVVTWNSNGKHTQLHKLKATIEVMFE